MKPACAVINNKLVIAGGYSGNTHQTYHKSSEVIDLSTRKIVYAGDMSIARAQFHLAITTLGGATKLLAIGGQWEYSSCLTSVEHFQPSNNSWTLATTTMEEKRSHFGHVVVQPELVCPNFESLGPS